MTVCPQSARNKTAEDQSACHKTAPIPNQIDSKAAAAAQSTALTNPLDQISIGPYALVLILVLLDSRISLGLTIVDTRIHRHLRRYIAISDKVPRINGEMVWAVTPGRSQESNLLGDLSAKAIKEGRHPRSAKQP